MSMLSHIYISTPELAASYDASPALGESVSAHYTGFEPRMFEGLWCIIEGGEWDGAHADHFECVFMSGDRERRVHRFPDALVALLAGLDYAAAGAAAKTWVESGEIEAELAEIRPMLKTLTRLAKTARESGRSLYLWNRM